MENKDILLLTATAYYGVTYTIMQLESGLLYLEGKYCDQVVYRERFTQSDNLLQAVRMMYSEILLLGENPEDFTLGITRYARIHYNSHAMCYVHQLFNKNYCLD